MSNHEDRVTIEPGASPTDHPVDAMLAMGFTISPEEEARLRALCDELIELQPFLRPSVQGFQE